MYLYRPALVMFAGRAGDKFCKHTRRIKTYYPWFTRYFMPGLSTKGKFRRNGPFARWDFNTTTDLYSFNFKRATTPQASDLRKGEWWWNSTMRRLSRFPFSGQACFMQQMSLLDFWRNIDFSGPGRSLSPSPSSTSAQQLTLCYYRFDKEKFFTDVKFNF